MREPAAPLSKAQRVAKATVIETLIELYNPAQLDVLARASVIAQEQLSEGR